MDEFYYRLIKVVYQIEFWNRFVLKTTQRNGFNHTQKINQFNLKEICVNLRNIKISKK